MSVLNFRSKAEVVLYLPSDVRIFLVNILYSIEIITFDFSSFVNLLLHLFVLLIYLLHFLMMLNSNFLLSMKVLLLISSVFNITKYSQWTSLPSPVENNNVQVMNLPIDFLYKSNFQFISLTYILVLFY